MDHGETRIVLFNKPYGVVTQFRESGDQPTLKDYIPLADVYSAGRLDKDSEGLLVLSDDALLLARLTHPTHRVAKVYWAQVEGAPDASALARLRRGVRLKDGVTRPAEADLMAEPDGLWPRTPPIRFRKHIPTAWLRIVLREGKNRQVRRMTAAVGYPTLRLIRYAVGPWTLDGLPPGHWKEISGELAAGFPI